MDTPMLTQLGTLGSGEPVYDRPRSHLHGDVSRVLVEALLRIESAGREFFRAQVDFDRVIGETVCVATSDADEIVYAQRPGRRGMTRFVKNRQAEPCSSVVVILKRDARESYYILITGFVGHLPEPEPWDEGTLSRAENPAAARAASRSFWLSHALVWGSEPVELGTQTTVCPW